MARKYKRDLETPLAESKFDPADRNKDGYVSAKEQKAYNRLQKLKAKGEAQAKNLSENKKKGGATKGSGAKAIGKVITSAASTIAGIGGTIAAIKR